jgi:hypothetical protein
VSCRSTICYHIKCDLHWRKRSIFILCSSLLLEVQKWNFATAIWRRTEK